MSRIWLLDKPRDLLGEIASWQASSEMVQIGGVLETAWEGTSITAGNYTLISPAFSIRQDTLLRQLAVRVKTASGAAWKFKLWRWTGATYTPVADVPFTPAESEATCVVNLATPLAVTQADIPGLYNPADNAMYVTEAVMALPPRYGSGDVTANYTFPATGTKALAFELRGHRPYLAVTGDSIAEGHNNGGPTSANSWHGPLHDTNVVRSVPGGVRSSEIAWQLRSKVGGGTLLEYQNLAMGGQNYAWVSTTGAPAAIAVQPHTLLIHCGVNDVSGGREWAWVLANLNTIKALVAASVTQRLLICEILPWTAGTDEQAATIRTWNANLAAWCANNGATLVHGHDAMAQVRASTGERDDLLAAYDQDGVHLTTAGVDAYAAIIRQYL